MEVPCTKIGGKKFNARVRQEKIHLFILFMHAIYNVICVYGKLKDITALFIINCWVQFKWPNHIDDCPKI